MSDPNAQGEGFEINFEDAGAAPQPPQAGYTPEQLAYYQQQQAYYQQQQAYYQAQQTQAQGVLTPPPGDGSPAPVSQSSKTMAEGTSATPIGGNMNPISQSSQTMADGSTSAPDSHNIHALIGRTIDRYRIHKLLGEGGFGAVYKAEHTLMKREVAFKTLHKEHATDPAVLHRFLREGQVAARFKHKHAIDVFDFGPLGDGAYFMAMEFLPGKDLRDHIKKRGALELSETFDVMIMTLQALQAAHDGGVIHRDLKPDNIKLEARDGRENYVKVLDFGIAKLKEIAEEKHEGSMSTDEANKLLHELGSSAADPPAASASYKTQMGAFFGTPEYGSPEQCAGDEIDHRSDLYTMGVIMYECLTGSLPFVSKTPQGYLAQHMVAQPRPIREIRPDLQIPAEVEVVLHKALEKNRDDRYQNANEFAESLLECANKINIPITVEGAKVKGLSRAKIALMVLAPLVLLSAVFFVVWKSKQDPEREAFTKTITELMGEGNYDSVHEKLTSDDPIANRLRKQYADYFNETLTNVDSLRESRDKRITTTFDEVKKKYDATAVEDRNYEAALQPLDDLTAGAETGKAAQIDKVKALRKKIAEDRVADADAWWQKTSPDLNKLMDGEDYDGASKLLQTFPGKFKDTPTQRVVNDGFGSIDEAKKVSSPERIQAREALAAASKFESDHLTEWAAIFSKYEEIIKNPAFKDAPARGGAQNRLLDAKKRWQKAAAAKLTNLCFQADKLAAPGAVKGFNDALSTLDEFPLDRYAGTEAAQQFPVKRKEILTKAADAFNAADAKARAQHDAFKVAEAKATIEEWTGFNYDKDISDKAKKYVTTYDRNLEIHKTMVHLPRAQVTYGEIGETVMSPPQGPVTVTAFDMMESEVTNEQFRSYLEDTGQLGQIVPHGWQGGNFPAHEEAFPVRGVSWHECKKFCEWAGLDLPTEMQWEYAARGADPFKSARDAEGKIDPGKKTEELDYPWGRFIRDIKGYAQFAAKAPAKVGTFPGGDAHPAPGLSIHDMAGNVAEWTKDPPAKYQGCTQPAINPQMRVVRGGHFKNTLALQLRSTFRMAQDPASRDETIGFRCVKPAE